MSLILNIETATAKCSVSLSKKGETVGFKEIDNQSYSHGKYLHSLIQSLMQESNLEFKQLQAIAVSKGPGSYTGLRIGVAAAKGLCFSLELPLISVDTLTLLAHSCEVAAGLKIPMIDARRMEVYCQVLDQNNQIIESSKPVIIDSSSFSNYLEDQKVTFIGSGSEKCKSVILHRNASFQTQHSLDAQKMASLSFSKFQQQAFEDLAYFEPAYLKEFRVGNAS